MNHLDIAKKEGGERFDKNFMHRDKYDNEYVLSISTPGIKSFISDHERAIEIALLKDLVEEIGVMEIPKPTELEMDVTIDTHGLHGGMSIASNSGYNEALTTLITKYQDRIKKLKS